VLICKFEVQRLEVIYVRQPNYLSMLFFLRVDLSSTICGLLIKKRLSLNARFI
jgi:hypothetical protein